MAKIAVVDDEKKIREIISIALKKEYHEISEYSDGLTAWEHFQSSIPDLIILDILMPRMNGLELCKKIRNTSYGKNIPIIFLSSKDEEIDRILGLESGGDDYVCKPFSIRELMARLHSGLRRTNASREESFPTGEIADENTESASTNPLFIDENRHIARWKRKILELTVTEFRILKLLSGNPGFIKSREQLMEAAFPEDRFPNDRAADSHIKRIRQKFLEADKNFTELESVYGLGYRWKENQKKEKS